jgi:hypothetical protein
MSDSYQAIYDAVRSRIGGGNIGEAVTDAARTAFDISYAIPIVTQEICIAAARCQEEITRPSAVYRPAISVDGNQWCALYGDNLQAGVAGFGDSPALAMSNFDANWLKKL